MQYVVVDAGGIRVEHASGWADLARQRPAAPDTTFMAYSMSKTITAAAVLQLAERGRVGLDDPADRYVDRFPYGPAVTLRQLIAHTSGIPNPIPLRWVHLAARHDDFDEPAALRAVLARHPRLSRLPGSRYAYSNVGYWLLGTVVERASGQPFTSYVGEHVLAPLGIEPCDLGYAIADPGRHATGYLEKYSVVNLAKGFLIDRELIGSYHGGWLEIRSHYPNGPAFGGLVGTARAFGRFLQDQLRERSLILGGVARQWFYEPQRTAGGAPVAMTLGWHIDDRRGRRCFFKEGGGGGFHSMMRLYPDRGVGTVILSNATGFDVKGTLDAIDPLCF